ncbi:hypothetical protein BJV78DRAFT_1158090 [Lactifluus subvellereus]|nr:hypothetical protein BJV78DRAFT_1158090 [Lactifluus subvellereus]
MVNWNDPSVLLKDYLTLIKLDHAIAGIYIWETVFTAGFELDVLRGKRPYRWTIWLYLGTRYCGLLVFILTLIGEDGGKVSCQAFSITDPVLMYASWAFASLIIILRVQVITATLTILPSSCHFSSRIAIWNHQRIVSFLSVGAWLAGVATIIHSLTKDTCTLLGLHKYLSSGVAVLVVDIVLFMSMLIGLLRHVHRSSTGIWYLLYQQCIIWIALASIADVPVVVGLPNSQFEWSLGTARLYRSLCQHGSLTEYMTSELPGIPISNTQYGAGNVHSSIHFVAATQSNNTVSTSEAPTFIPKDTVQLRFTPGVSNPRLVHEKSEDKVGYDLETS